MKKAGGADSIMKRIAFIASGRGSNFQAIIDSIANGFIQGECVRLITDNPGAYAIERSKNAGIPVSIVEFGSFESKDRYEEQLMVEMERCDADLFVLAGYMRIIGKEIVRRYYGRMINIHPALLPSFTGLHAQRQALEYGVKVAGCTVHFVDENMDHGPIIVQRAVDVHEHDDENTLAGRILEEEHNALAVAVKLFCEDKLRIEGRKVSVLI